MHQKLQRPDIPDKGLSMRRLIVAAAMLALGACSSNLMNMPKGPVAAYDVPGPLVSVQVDQFGDFYPDDWHLRPGEANIGSQGSVALAIPVDERAGRVADTRGLVLERVRRTTTGKRRVFILIHGFNDETPSAASAFAVIKQTIALTPEDAIVEFHWDGLTDEGRFLNGGRIWFPAVTTSQQAGSRGLRDLLGVLSNQNVVFITHSRGASVVLSAFSNPNYRTSYRDGFHRAGLADYLDPAEPGFVAQGLTMDAIFLAPAIGNPDFWANTCLDQEGCHSFRGFPGLRSIRHSLNPGDPVLAKRFVAANPFSFACWFNPTSLGQTENCGSRVREHYNPAGQSGLIQPYRMPPLKTHSFLCYAAHPVLRQMLHDIGVESRGGLRLDAAPPRSCDAKADWR